MPQARYDQVKALVDVVQAAGLFADDWKLLLDNGYKLGTSAAEIDEAIREKEAADLAFAQAAVAYLHPFGARVSGTTIRVKNTLLGNVADAQASGIGFSVNVSVQGSALLAEQTTVSFSPGNDIGLDSFLLLNASEGEGATPTKYALWFAKTPAATAQIAAATAQAMNSTLPRGASDGSLPSIADPDDPLLKQAFSRRLLRQNLMAAADRLAIAPNSVRDAAEDLEKLDLDGRATEATIYLALVDADRLGELKNARSRLRQANTTADAARQRLAALKTPLDGTSTNEDIALAIVGPEPTAWAGRWSSWRRSACRLWAMLPWP